MALAFFHGTFKSFEVLNNLQIINYFFYILDFKIKFNVLEQSRNNNVIYIQANAVFKKCGYKIKYIFFLDSYLTFLKLVGCPKFA